MAFFPFPDPQSFSDLIGSMTEDANKIREADQSFSKFDAKGFVDAAINKVVDAVYNVTAQRVGKSNMPENFREDAYNQIFYNEKLRNGAIQQHLDSLNLTSEARQELYNKATAEARTRERETLGTRLDSFNTSALSDQTIRGNVLDRLQLSDAQQKLFVLFGDLNKIMQFVNELIRKGPLSLREMYDNNPELGKTDLGNVSGPRTPSFVPEHQKMNNQNLTPIGVGMIGRSFGR